jgi:imidazolonepropionase-like amidohydrolase
VSGASLAWAATREEETKSDGAKKDDKKDEDDKPDPNRYAGIPEQFGLPFGPYAYDAVPAQKDMVIRNATIWTSGPAGIIENGVMIVQGGKVTGVYKAADAPAIKLRDGSVVIDAAGKHITPGLIDCHSHTGIMGGVNEGTQSCTAEVRIFDVIDPDSVNWYRELAGGLTAANQLHGSANAIGGQNSVVKLRWGCESPDDMRIDGAIPGIKFALGENVKQSNWGLQANSRYPQTRMGVETYIVDRFTAGREYAASWAKWNAMSDGDKAKGVPPRRDLELEAMAEILAGQRLVHCHSYRQDEILMLCRVAKNFGFKIGTFQHVLEGYKVAEAIREQAIGASAFSDWWGFKWEVFDAIPYAGSIMHDAGVVVSFNSDSDELARRMNYEAGKAVKYGGVDLAEALKFVTANPAKQLAVEKMMGSLAAGMDADFAIWSGDPLSTLTRCEATYIDGREYFSLARDAELRKANEATRARIMKKLLDKPAASEKPSSEGDRPAGGRRPRGVGQDGPPPTEMLGGRGWGLAPIGDGGMEEAQELAQRRALEAQFHWMIQNGIDPVRARCGDCGCSVHAAFAQ